MTTPASVNSPGHGVTDAMQELAIDGGHVSEDETLDMDAHPTSRNGHHHDHMGSAHGATSGATSGAASGAAVHPINIENFRHTHIETPAFKVMDDLRLAGEFIPNDYDGAYADLIGWWSSYPKLVSDHWNRQDGLTRRDRARAEKAVDDAYAYARKAETFLRKSEGSRIMRPKGQWEFVGVCRSCGSKAKSELGHLFCGRCRLNFAEYLASVRVMAQMEQGDKYAYDQYVFDPELPTIQ